MPTCNIWRGVLGLLAMNGNSAAKPVAPAAVRAGRGVGFRNAAGSVSGVLGAVTSGRNRPAAGSDGLGGFCRRAPADRTPDGALGRRGNGCFRLDVPHVEVVDTRSSVVNFGSMPLEGEKRRPRTVAKSPTECPHRRELLLPAASMASLGGWSERRVIGMR